MKILSFLPEILLLINVLVIEVTHFIRRTQTPKTFATISKFFIGLALAGCIIFYNISYDEKWYINSLYTTFFKSLLLLCSLFLNFLACKWFVSKNYPSYRYYQIISLSLLALLIAISCRHLGIFALVIIIDQILMGKLSHFTDENKENEDSSIINKWQIMILTGLLIISIGWFYYITGSLQYHELIDFYTKTSPSFPDKLAVMIFIAAILFIIGAAPFHVGLFQRMKYSNLPSSGYMFISSLIAGQSLLVMFSYQNFPLFAPNISELLLLCGVTSLFMGAMGIESCKHIRQQFYCINLFNIGIVLILYSNLTRISIESGLIYSLVYGLSLMGLYTCCYGMRYRGEYLSDINELSGLSLDRPLLASALIVFCISLLGIPPLLGMLSNFAVFNVLWTAQKWGLLIMIFAMFIVAANGILSLIKSVYFNPKRYHFDRIDRGVYLCLLCNITLMILIVLNPKYLMQDIETMIQNFLM